MRLGVETVKCDKRESGENESGIKRVMVQGPAATRTARTAPATADQGSVGEMGHGRGRAERAAGSEGSYV